MANVKQLQAGGLALVAVVAVVGLGVMVLGEDPTATDERTRLPLPDTSTDSVEPTTPKTQPLALTPSAPKNGGAVSMGGGADAIAPLPSGNGETTPAPVTDDPSVPAGAAVAVIRCLDPQGQPLSGARIEAQRASGAPLVPVVTDASGEVRLTGLVPGESIRGVGRHPSSRDAAAFGPVKVDGSAIVLHFRSSPLGDLAGTIADDRGQPVSEAELILMDPKNPQGTAVLDTLSMSLRPDGSFSAPVAAGTYTVSARAAGFGDSDRTYVTVVAGQRAAPVALLLTRQGSIGGGLNLPKAGMSASSLDLVYELTTGTSENPYTRHGREALEVTATRFLLPDCDAGRYRLRLEAHTDTGAQVGGWSIVVLSPGESITGIVLSLGDVVVAVSGTVTDDQGAALSGVTVSIGARRSVSADDGNYALRGLDLGEQYVEAKKDGHAPAFEPVHYRGSALTLDLVLPRNGGVRGEVRDAQGPAKNTPVLVVFEQEDGVRPTETTTDATGRYQIDGLSPGSYYIKAGFGADPFEQGNAPGVRVRPGEVVDAPLVRVP